MASASLAALAHVPSASTLPLNATMPASLPSRPPAAQRLSGKMPPNNTPCSSRPATTVGSAITGSVRLSRLAPAAGAAPSATPVSRSVGVGGSSQPHLLSPVRPSGGGGDGGGGDPAGTLVAEVGGRLAERRRVRGASSAAARQAEPRDATGPTRKRVAVNSEQARAFAEALEEVEEAARRAWGSFISGGVVTPSRPASGSKFLALADPAGGGGATCATATATAPAAATVAAAAPSARSAGAVSYLLTPSSTQQAAHCVAPRVTTATGAGFSGLAAIVMAAKASREQQEAARLVGDAPIGARVVGGAGAHAPPRLKHDKAGAYLEYFEAEQPLMPPRLAVGEEADGDMYASVGGVASRGRMPGLSGPGASRGLRGHTPSSGCSMPMWTRISSWSLGDV